MSKVKEILRLKFDVGLSLRDIAASCNCGKSTVDDILKRAQNANVSWPCDLNDKELLSLIYPPAESRKKAIEPDLNYIFNEMKKKNVTLMLLWEEYKRDNPDGLMYTQFCERYRNFKKSNQITMHIEHKAGEEMQVDWAGSTIPYIEPSTGEEKRTYIFVSVLPASAYPFAYAYGDMKLPNWIDAHIRTFEYYGGVPRIVIPDNTKTAVKVPSLLDPQLNASYLEMAQHYGTTLVPARPGKPKDKASDENMVGNISRRIIAALRNHQFFSLLEINQAIKTELNRFINRPFQKLEGNRLSAFETIDKPALKPLPASRYEYADWIDAKIAFNYHVEYQGFFYSVHYSNIGKASRVRATALMIEVFVDGIRVAAHKRNFNTYKRYTTLPEHMPESHKAVTAWNSERYLSWAEKIGSQTKLLVSNILDSREYPVQTYRACMGIMRLASSYPSEVVEQASKIAIEKRTCNYKYFSIIIRQMTQKDSTCTSEKVITNINLRGAKAYAGGGLNEKNDNTNIGDLVRYIRYNNFEVIQGEVYSVFDLLYKEYTKQRIAFLNKSKKISEFDSENLIYSLIIQILKQDAFYKYDIIMHQPLNMLIRNPEKLTDNECNYAMNPATHIDFLIYNKLDKLPILAIEVDGYSYHKEGTIQHGRDEMKNIILTKYSIPYLRLSTVGSKEREKIITALSKLD